MPEPKVDMNSSGQEMHYSVGAVIIRDGKFLLLNRVKPPFGWAGPAGHVDQGESPEIAIRREVLEETGLQVTHMTLLYVEQIDGNICRHSVICHYWCLYACEAHGDFRAAATEAKSMIWASQDDLHQLNLEQVWEHWFRKLGVL